MRVVLVMVVGMLTGCEGTIAITPEPSGGGGGAGPNGSFESGSRLKARTLVGDDGARSPAGWYDSELEVECSWLRMAADESTRCVPRWSGATYFSDAACAQPLVLKRDCQLEAYAATSDGCGGIRVYPVGQPVSPPMVYSKSDGGCVSVPPPDGQLYSLGAEMLPAAFVSATLKIED